MDVADRQASPEVLVSPDAGLKTEGDILAALTASASPLPTSPTPASVAPSEGEGADETMEYDSEDVEDIWVKPTKGRRRRHPRRMPVASPSGGYRIPHDHPDVVSNRVGGLVWAKKTGLGFITQGKVDVINLTLPVCIFHGASYLEWLGIVWTYSVPFLTRASRTKDPIERLKLISCFQLVNQHRFCSAKKPFNPILGETHQVLYADGTRVYFEQVSHHPPVTAWEIFGANDSFHMAGHGEWRGSFTMGHGVCGAQYGTTHYWLPDGGEVRWTNPQMSLTGLIMGDMQVDFLGSVEFVDEQNELVLKLDYSPDQSWWGSLMGTAPKSDTIRGRVVRRSADAEPKKKSGWFGWGKQKDEDTVLSTLRGSWLGSIKSEKTRYWHFAIEHGATEIVGPPEDELLPSDARYRQDAVAKREGREDEAAEWKHRLEEIQRQERRWRQGKELTPNAAAAAASSATTPTSRLKLSRLSSGGSKTRSSGPATTSSLPTSPPPGSE